MQSVIMDREMLEPPNYDDLSVPELVILAQEGDEMAFTCLHFKFFGMLKEKCRKFGIPECDHNDLMQKAYIKVFAKIETIQPERFAGYIKTAMLNIIKNYIKDKIRDEGIFGPFYLLGQDDDDNQKSIEDLIGEAPKQAIDITCKEARKMIAFIMEKMPPKYRNVLVLIDWEGYSYKEAADILNMNPKSVGPLLFRARLKFIKLSKKYFPGWYDELF